MMTVKRSYSNQERQYLLSTIDRIKAERKVSDERACIEVGVPLTTFYGWKRKMKMKTTISETKPMTALSSFLFSNNYKPEVSVILVGAS